MPSCIGRTLNNGSLQAIKHPLADEYWYFIASSIRSLNKTNFAFQVLLIHWFWLILDSVLTYSNRDYLKWPTPFAQRFVEGHSTQSHQKLLQAVGTFPFQNYHYCWLTQRQNSLTVCKIFFALLTFSTPSFFGAFLTPCLAIVPPVELKWSSSLAYNIWNQWFGKRMQILTQAELAVYAWFA